MGSDQGVEVVLRRINFLDYIAVWCAKPVTKHRQSILKLESENFCEIMEVLKKAHVMQKV
jgi:hypothetical protein